MDAFDRAVELSGGQAALARRIGVTPQALIGWRKRGIPPDRVLDMARVCDFAVTPNELRPDIYPSPDDGLPPDMKGRAAA